MKKKQKQKISFGKDVEKLEALCTAGVTMKTVGEFLKKLNFELPYCLAIPLLGIFPQEGKART